MKPYKKPKPKKPDFRDERFAVFSVFASLVVLSFLVSITCGVLVLLVTSPIVVGHYIWTVRRTRRYLSSELNRYISKNVDLQTLGGLRLLDEICEDTGYSGDEVKLMASNYSKDNPKYRFEKFDDSYAFWHRRY